MTPPKPVSFKLRDKLHGAQGTLTKRELLKQIRAGKLSGEEEIAAPPYDHWQKLSSHPDFYDAFLKRLFKDDYKSPNPETENEESARSRKHKTVHERATRQADPENTRAVKEYEGDEGKGHLGEERLKEIGATIHQSDIDALFKDGSAPPPGPQKELEFVPSTGLGTQLIELELPPIESSLPPDIEKTRRLDFSSDRGPDELPPGMAEAAPPTTKTNRRKLVYGGALVVMLVLLFQMGKGDGTHGRRGDLLGRPPVSETSRQLLATNESKESRIKAFIEEGDALVATDTPPAYAAAHEVFRDAVSVDEANPLVLGKLAQAAGRLLPTSPASEALLSEIKTSIERGRVSDPHNSQFYRVEALVALHEDKLVEARRLMLNATEADPINAENLLVTAEVLYASGELTSAKMSAEDSLKTSPSSIRAHLLISEIAIEQRDTARARAEALEALKLNPLHPRAYLLLADAVALQDQTKEARGLYETCGKLAKFAAPGVVAKAYLRLGLLLETEGNQEAARRYFLLAHHYGPEVPGVQEKIKDLEINDDAVKTAAEEMEYGKSYFQTQAEGLFKQKKYAEAVKFFQAARLTDPKDSLALVRLGEVREKTAASYEDFRQVMNLYQRAIEIDPSQPLGYLRLGSLETEQYNLDRAYKLLSQAVALAPNESAPYVALGKHYYRRQDYAEALNQFLKAAKINPSDSEISYYAGLLRLLFKKDGVKDAPRFFYQAYTLDPTNYDALVEWLKLKVTANPVDKTFAIKFLHNLIEAEPKNASLYWALGEVYATNKEFRRAINFYHQSLDLENRASKVRMSLARALEAIGEQDKAVAEYRLASILDRRNSEGFFRAADIYFQRKLYNEAEVVLKDLINIAPSYPGAHRHLSKVYQARKDKDQAIAMMKQEVTSNPQNAKFRIELAELYMEYEKYDLAVSELTEVTNLPSLVKAPEYVYDKVRGYLLLSRCYRAQSKPESAEGVVRLALDIDSSDPELHKELGFVYYALQRDKEGVREFETYLNRSPAARDAAEIKGLIQQMIIEE